ncbi:hypothetical protein R4P70_29770 [Rhodococcus sp. IEGM 1241]|uniref:hypothetical protein n=1 Tax=Rhodococcus sp. IEGM 1241 TaxID=3082228 RepID=UPI002952C89B|nr:hypothetical protein [Rhodococcus sp. IEGM 1241]MDV8015514.1 hypothetical protein [Rhodococcus sp. IEGM 1241]
MLDPDGSVYIAIPYRTLSNPAVSVWEHRQALARLREKGQGEVDEAVLFRMIEQMRHIAETAEKTTKKTHREAERRTHASAAAPPTPQIVPAPTVPPEPLDDAAAPAARFQEIEQW